MHSYDCLLILAFLGLLLLPAPWLGRFYYRIMEGQRTWLTPRQVPGLEWSLAFNTTTSVVGNTNCQAYSGEASLSDLSQMAGLTVQNFVSAAIGIYGGDAP
jgi:K+-transporting ATPase ATPase A chain